jgi:hypothetical protein
MTTRKPPSRKTAPAPPPALPVVVVKPVPDKIGEPPGNLRSRAAAFKRRRGGG